MADNYLERRMEELRSPQTTTFRPQTRRIGLGWSLPKLRVVVMAVDSVATARSIVDGFSASGCRVTLVSDNESEGNALARRGIRFCHVGTSDKTELQNAMSQTLTAWRDVDIVISVESSLPQIQAIAEVWDEHRRRFPAVGDYGGRLIQINRASAASENPAITDLILPKRVTANRITVTCDEGTTPSEGTAQSVARVCLFLALPESGTINGAEIPVAID